MHIYRILFLLIPNYFMVTGENILFLLPIASKSHKNVFDPLIEGLADKGHHLTVISPMKAAKPHPRIEEFSPVPLDHIFGSDNMPNAFHLRGQNLIERIKSWNWTIFIENCETTYENTKFRELVKREYDLVILNGMLNNCFYGLLPGIGAPYIYVTTFPAPNFVTKAVGNRIQPSFVPSTFLSFSDNMSFQERLINFSIQLLLDIGIHSYSGPWMESIYKKYLGPNTPGLDEIDGNVSLIFMNSHFTFTYPRPLLPDVVEVGGMHCRPGKPLPEELEHFISSAEHGVIYFSLGSIVKARTMPEKYRKVFINVFSRLKQKVLWKWETEGMEDLPPNVKLSKWLPQQDVLAHPNVKLFMTHGGLLSTQEALYHGIPLLGFPLFADQDLNMKQAEKSGCCLTMEILDLNEEALEAIISKLLNEPQYSERATALSKVFRDQPQTPLDRAIFWSEYIMRHKGAHHLRSAARRLNYWQYHSIDVILFLISLVIVVIFGIVTILKLVCRKLCKSGNNSAPTRPRKVKRN